MPITPQEALQRTIEHREIFHDEMLHLMRLIMNGELSPVMTAAIITGLRVKKETIGEITAAAQVMREFSTKVNVADKTHLVDIVGTGGDGSHTFNISTCSMFVAAAAGAKVSKHGGRSVSSKSGSADVLESYFLILMLTAVVLMGRRQLLGPLAATALIFWRTRVHFRNWRAHRWMPLLVGFGLVALFIWFAENIATFANAWNYPGQESEWRMVSLAKYGSWYLLMLISFVLVTLVQPVRAPD